MYRIDQKKDTAFLGAPGHEVAIIGGDGFGKAMCFDGSALSGSGCVQPDDQIAEDFDARLASQYPGKIPEDTDDFYHRPFRVLSCALIEGHWIDLRDEKMMRRATKLFSNVTLYKNHGSWNGYDVDRWIGQSLRPAFTKSLGVSGVDAIYRFDRTRSEAGAVIRGLEIEPPAIRSTSAAFAFRSRRSHTDMSSGDFYSNLGREVDGEIVRWIVTEILRVYELSIVYAGADRNATALSEFFPGSNPGGEAAELGEQNKQSEGQTMDENKDEARVKKLEEELEAARSEVAELSEYRDSIKALGEHSVTEIRAALEFRAERLEDARERARKAYLASRTKDQSESEAMLGVIARMSFEEAEAMAVEFRGALEDRHELRCAKCNSTDVTRLSSGRPEVPNVDRKGDKSAKTQVPKPVSAYAIGKRR